MFKEIPEFPGYFVDETGDVRSTKQSNRNRNGDMAPLKQFMWNKYWAVPLTDHGKEIKKKVAYLVLTTFVGPRPENAVICHGPKGKLVDSLDNLSWGTHFENEFDKIRDGTVRKGSKSPVAVFNELQVRVIRRSYDIFKVRIVDLAKIFSTSHGSIGHIVHKRTWKHVA